MIILSRHLFPRDSEYPPPISHFLGGRQKIFGANAPTPSPQNLHQVSASSRGRGIPAWTAWSPVLLDGGTRSDRCCEWIRTMMAPTTTWVGEETRYTVSMVVESLSVSAANLQTAGAMGPPGRPRYTWIQSSNLKMTSDFPTDRCWRRTCVVGSSTTHCCWLQKTKKLQVISMYTDPAVALYSILVLPVYFWRSASSDSV